VLEYDTFIKKRGKKETKILSITTSIIFMGMMMFTSNLIHGQLDSSATTAVDHDGYVLDHCTPFVFHSNQMLNFTIRINSSMVGLYTQSCAGALASAKQDCSTPTSYSVIVCQDPRYQQWLLHYYNSSQNYDIIAKTIKVVNNLTQTINARVNQSELNTRLNSILDFCLNALPNGIQACDKQLKNLVTEVCATNNGRLDACHNGKVDQYYVARAAAVSKSAINKTR
jgi:hypothetical protein